NVSRAAQKVALITASSEIFTEHFALIAEHLNDTSKAYDVLERARGRATTELIRTAQRPNEHDVEVDKQISRLRLNLLKATSPIEVRNIRDEMFLAEQSRWTGPVGDLTKQSHQPIPLAAIRNALSEDEVVLSYVLSEPRAYCLVIWRAGNRIV